MKTEGTGELQDSQDVPPQTPPLDVNENEESLQEGDEEQENINEEDDTGSDITVDEPVFKTVNRVSITSCSFFHLFIFINVRFCPCLILV